MRILVLIVVVLFLASCQGSDAKKEKVAEKNSVVELKEEVLSIGKMHCEMCVASIEKGLKSVEGVEFVKVSLDDSTAVVRYDATKANIHMFREAVERRGYLLKNKDLEQQ